mgnify:CR=1 FL=1
MANIITVPLAENIFKKIRLLINWFYCRVFIKNMYITERYRPVYANRDKRNFIDKTSDVAILMRGQIEKIDEFTKNTLKMYRINYPNAPILLSTWEHCIDDDFYLFAEKKKIQLVLTKFEAPKTGHKNDNLQIISNVNGLKEVLKKNIKYTISTRSDQRFYYSNVLSYLKNILSIYRYPISNNTKDKQINRLVAMSFDTLMYRLYSIEDMFLFGLTEDVFNYWNSDHDIRVFDKKKNICTLKELAKRRESEVYFMTEFLKRNGHDLKWTLKDYFEVIKNRFIIIDSHSLDFLWPKYSFFEERFKDFEGIKYKEISFSDWLLIKNGQLYPNENILDIKMVPKKFKLIKEFFKK